MDYAVLNVLSEFPQSYIPRLLRFRRQRNNANEDQVSKMRNLLVDEEFEVDLDEKDVCSRRRRFLPDCSRTTRDQQHEASRLLQISQRRPTISSLQLG